MSRGWKARALALAARLPLSRLHPGALAAAPDGTWGVAFSGGGDSLALVLLLWAHFPARRPALVALHFNHRLRGAESAADARFCRQVCRGLGIRFDAGNWARRTAGPAPSEAEARSARNAFLETACLRRRVAALWLGHQLDDIAESMLMRLARGAGTAGLAAPRPSSRSGKGKILRLRPLLTVSRAEVLEALAGARIPFRTDSSNAQGTHFRNRVRHRVIPEWGRAADPGRNALAGAALSRQLLQEDDEALEAWVDRCRALTADGRLSLRRLKGCPPAVWRRALYRWLQGARLSRAAFEDLLAKALAGRDTQASLGTGAFAKLRKGWILRTGG